MAALHILASDIDEYIEAYKKELIYDASSVFTLWEKEVIQRCAQDCGFDLSLQTSEVCKEHMEEREYNLVFVVRGPYTISSSAIFHTQSGQFKIKALIFHEDFAKRRYAQIAKQLIKDNNIIMPPGSDEEYLLEMLRDAEETVRWEKANVLAPGASIWDIRFDEWGHFVRKELDTVPL